MKQSLESRVCFKCGSDKTYINKTGYEQWFHDKEDNLICNKCHCKQHYIENREYRINDNLQRYYDNREHNLARHKQWKKEHSDYHKAYQAVYDSIHREYRNQQARIKRAIKRGWGKID